MCCQRKKQRFKNKNRSREKKKTRTGAELGLKYWLVEEEELGINCSLITYFQEPGFGILIISSIHATLHPAFGFIVVYREGFSFLIFFREGFLVTF